MCVVDEALGLSVRFYPDGRPPCFEHPCKLIGIGDTEAQLVCAPALPHAVELLDGLVSITPSVLCPDCGTHGYVTDGQWRSC